uniref:Sulfotransfer_1 domain-containing protein n=1 Tax=Haemonchus contortus TaxID=6289 RepID=A0A7I4YKT2_HAECO
KMLLWLSQQVVLMTLSVAIPVELPRKSFPTAIIVGVKKAGTRALLEFLRINPNIRAPGPEVHFFDKNYHKGLEWYREKMPLSKGSQLTIEKSPAYFHSRTAAERIRALNPAMKIIVVVRNPVMRAISDYTQASSKRRTFGVMPSFEDMAVGDCAPWLKTNCSLKVGGVNVGWGAIRIGLYHKHMKRWLDNFPKEQIHIVDGERLVTQPAIEVSETERFLGLEPVVKEEHFGIDPVKKFPCVRRSNGSLHCLGKTKGRKHPRVRREVVQRLHRFYEPENRKFFLMINRILAW